MLPQTNIPSLPPLLGEKGVGEFATFAIKGGGGNGSVAFVYLKGRGGGDCGTGRSGWLSVEGRHRCTKVTKVYYKKRYIEKNKELGVDLNCNN